MPHLAPNGKRREIMEQIRSLARYGLRPSGLRERPPRLCHHLPGSHSAARASVAFLPSRMPLTHPQPPPLGKNLANPATTF
jgi:hypothetical protein